jgi:hypothetical protein
MFYLVKNLYKFIKIFFGVIFSCALVYGRNTVGRNGLHKHSYGLHKHSYGLHKHSYGLHRHS